MTMQPPAYFVKTELAVLQSQAVSYYRTQLKNSTQISQKTKILESALESQAQVVVEWAAEELIESVKNGELGHMEVAEQLLNSLTGKKHGHTAYVVQLLCILCILSVSKGEQTPESQSSHLLIRIFKCGDVAAQSLIHQLHFMLQQASSVHTQNILDYIWIFIHWGQLHAPPHLALLLNNHLTRVACFDSSLSLQIALRQSYLLKKFVSDDFCSSESLSILPEILSNVLDMLEAILDENSGKVEEKEKFEDDVESTFENVKSVLFEALWMSIRGQRTCWGMDLLYKILLQIKSLDPELFQHTGNLNVIILGCMSVSVPINVKLKMLNLLYEEIENTNSEIQTVEYLLCELLGVQMAAYGQTHSLKNWGQRLLKSISKNNVQQIDFTDVQNFKTNGIVSESVRWVVGWISFSLSQSVGFGSVGNVVLQQFGELSGFSLENKREVSWVEICIASALFIGLLGDKEVGLQEVGAGCIDQFVRDFGDAGMVLLPCIMHRLQSVMQQKSSESKSKQLHLVMSCLPLLGRDPHVHPYILKTLTPFLRPPSPKLLRCLGIKLLVETWKQGGHRGWTAVLAAIKGVDTSEGMEFRLVRAQCIFEVCKEESYKALELVQEIQECLEDDDSAVQSLGLQSLITLCDDDVIEFYSAWRVVHRLFPQPPVSSAVFRKMVDLLRFGALDAANTPEQATSVVDLLWLCACSDDPKVRRASVKSLSAYSLEILDQIGALRTSHDYSQILDTEGDPTNRIQLMKLVKEVKQYEERSKRRLATSSSCSTDFSDDQQQQIQEARVLKKSMVSKQARNLIDRTQYMTPMQLCKGGRNVLGGFETPSAGPLMLLYNEDMVLKAGDDQGLLPETYEKACDVILKQCSDSNLFAQFFNSFSHNYLYSWEKFVFRWVLAKQWVFVKNHLFQLFKQEKNQYFRGNVCIALGALAAVKGGAQDGIKEIANFLTLNLYQSEQQQQYWLCVGAAMGLSRACTQLSLQNLSQLSNSVNQLKESMQIQNQMEVRSACGFALGQIAQYLIDAANSWGDEKLGQIIWQQIYSIISEMLQFVGDNRLQIQISETFSQIDDGRWQDFGVKQLTKFQQQKQKQISQQSEQVCAGVIFGLSNIFVCDSLKIHTNKLWQILYACISEEKYFKQDGFFSAFCQSAPVLVISQLKSEHMKINELKPLLNFVQTQLNSLQGTKQGQISCTWTTLICGAFACGIPLTILDLNIKEILKQCEKLVVQAQQQNGCYGAVSGALFAISCLFNTKIYDCGLNVEGILSAGQNPKESTRVLRVMEILAGFAKPLDYLKVVQMPAVKDVAQWALASAVVGLHY